MKLLSDGRDERLKPGSYRGGGALLIEDMWREKVNKIQ